jgi:hypothetical protein
VTQDWPGPLNARSTGPDQRFEAADIPTGAALNGMVGVYYTCFGGGVPGKSRFPYQLGEGIRTLAPVPFTAALPRAMLARGAGAVVAHVERAWDCGFSWENLPEPQLDAWKSVLSALLRGKRVGLAAGYLGNRYTAITAELGTLLFAEDAESQIVPPKRRAYLWMQHADARGWMVLGDPAARVAMAPL